MGYKVNKRLIWVNNEVRLPAEYQEVKYIENNGTAYILTGLNIKDGYRNLMKVRFTATQEETQYPGISGGYLGPDSGLSGGQGRFYLNGLQTNGRLNYGYLGNFGDIGSGLTTGTDYEIDYSWISGNAFVKLNGNTLRSSSATYSTSKPGIAPVGGGAHMDQSVGNQYRANPGIRIYYSKFYNSAGTLVRDLVPCYRKSDNVIGMYDLITDTFYTNNGTGTFTKGNDVPNLVEKQIYPAGWKPGENTIAYYPLTSTSTVNDLSGNNRNLTNHSVSFGTYSGVNCAYFNGSSQYLDETTINWGLINGNLTISFWCKVTAGVLNSIWYGRPYNGTFVLYNNLTSIYCDTSNNNNNTTHTTFSTSSLNIWNLITITWTGNTYTVYSNGTLSGSMTTSIPTSGNSHFYLGCVGNDVDGLRAYMTGHLSNYIIENKVWTASEILNYYNSTKSKYGL